MNINPTELPNILDRLDWSGKESSLAIRERFHVQMPVVIEVHSHYHLTLDLSSITCHTYQNLY